MKTACDRGDGTRALAVAADILVAMDRYGDTASPPSSPPLNRLGIRWESRFPSGPKRSLASSFT